MNDSADTLFGVVRTHASSVLRNLMSALGLLVASARWGEGIVLACLASAGTVSVLWAFKVRHQGRLAGRSERQASTSMALVEAIALASEAKDRTSERHLRRVRTYSVGIGRKLGQRRELGTQRPDGLPFGSRPQTVSAVRARGQARKNRRVTRQRPRGR